ncbi:hypothetical protein D3C85_1450910 [compost metagenome]
MCVAAQRDVGARLLREVAGRGIHVGIGRAGHHVVDRDATRAEVASQRLGQTGHGGLGHHVESPAGVRHVLAVDAADVHHPAALAHVLERFLRGNEQALEIDVHHAVEVVEADVLHGLSDGDGGVVHEDVQAPEGSEGLRHRSTHFVGPAGIGGDGKRFAARGFDGGDHGLRRFG